ncbi:TonB family protein [Pseudoalteromonas fenneropenaei]|uniref:Protein TonB n=1 Tax=Pseudoalteromonas fenneropenaei TaxID=1737459 RepID=A0ABV7CP96_9GAMM
MLSWLLSQQVWLSSLLLALIVAEKYLVPQLGARFVLRLWWALPVAILFSHIPTVWLAQLNAPVFTMSERFVVHPNSIPATAWNIAIDWLYGSIMVALMACCALQHRLFVRQLNIYQQEGQYYSSLLHAPMVIGIWQPRLVLPSQFANQFSSSQQALILLHEQTHLRRGDNQFSALMLLMCLINWFNPLFWLAFASLRRQQELACDEVVLDKQPNQVRLDYSKALLTSLQATQHVPMVFSQYGDKNMMLQRLQHIRQPNAIRRSVQAVVLLCLGTSLGAMALSNKTPTLEQPKKAHSSPIYRVEPKYPIEAAQQAIEGAVVLKFRLDAQGNTRDVEVLKAEPQAIFNKTSIAAVAQWRYTPPADTSVWHTVQLDYRMDAGAQTKPLLGDEVEMIRIEH